MKISSQLHALTALPRQHGQISLQRRLYGPQSRSECCGDERNLLPLPGIESPCIGHPARHLFTIPMGYSGCSVCMYVCMHVCMYVCVYVCVRAYVCMYVCVYVCMYHSLYASATDCTFNLFVQPDSTRSLELYILRSLPPPEI
jgi:hypothetical protein